MECTGRLGNQRIQSKYLNATTAAPVNKKTAAKATSFHRSAVFGRLGCLSSSVAGAGARAAAAAGVAPMTPYEAVALTDNGLQKPRIIWVIAQRQPNFANCGVDALFGVEKDVLPP